MKREKLRTHVSKVTTLKAVKKLVSTDRAGGRCAGDTPAGEGICALEIQLGTFFHKAIAIAPLVYSVFEMRIQDLHGYRDAVTGNRMWGTSGEDLPSVMSMQPSGYALYASCVRRSVL